MTSRGRIATGAYIALAIAIIALTVAILTAAPAAYHPAPATIAAPVATLAGGPFVPTVVFDPSQVQER